ncbi:NosD domain-containing protein [Halogeometricum luteum]|uniref:Right-handed parallel beta-helix repeat-containing protein n=1 Tax=Halogeometricum luteum TaxID=2950537 RepID=A0ABU2G0V7_9EURY|nr:NosD domain-containing protein [Halogeometricum sp. S3BR5-2]MDS0293929.1 right-handed parallel beta-helix repeat-containing protein [Halogeometricum sp. S3BR5-2]
MVVVEKRRAVADIVEHPRAFVLVAVALVGLAGCGLSPAPEGAATDAQGPQPVDSCTTITEPGRYALTGDIADSEADTCIRIRSDDVVLAGRDHRVDGVGAFGTAGVVVRPDGGGPLENVTVRNVTVTGWDDGVRYVRVVDGAVVGTTTADNRVGLSLLNARDNRVADNVARDNRLRGVSLLEASANNTVVNNTAIDNALFGIHVVEGGARNNTLAGNTASNNEFGIAVVGAHGNTVTGNTAAGNRIAGVWLVAARDNRVARNAVSDQFYGVFLSDRSGGNAVADNVAASNAVGIRLRSSDGNRIADNTVRSSGDTAVLLISSDDNAVVGNVGSDNARGISVVRSAGNSLANNSISVSESGPGSGES